MQTRRPVCANSLAIHSTRGVFPVPPVVRLPTLITGTPGSCTRNRPERYSARRVFIAKPYKLASGVSAIVTALFIGSDDHHLAAVTESAGKGIDSPAWFGFSSRFAIV